ncbi:hypothetical protein J5N97_007820 [Dioscorea zingiberensis]|uniref:Uncharacterized protein n=1 Tax=Dioscorea zingiberensis TaxID=325984 RepID=A0A9D5HUM3_9LILI|nr:hypothetical protein J5N97_007820 [Dioscorea zingiberensis]
MLKPMKKLSVLGILSDSMILIHENSKLITFLFLLLFPFNSLTTAVTQLKPFSLKLDIASLLPFQLPRLPKYITDEIGSPWEFEPVEYVLWWLSATSGIYLLSIALLMKPGTLSELFFIAGRRFKQFIITSLYVHVFMVLNHVLLIGPIFLDKNSENEMPVSIPVMVLNAAGLVAFVFSNAASLLCFVISTVEKNCYGFSAIRMAVEFIRGRKLTVFVLIALLNLMEQLLVDSGSVKNAEKMEAGLPRILLDCFLKTLAELVMQQ